MLFLFTFRKSSQFPETESKPHTVIHEGAEHKETVEINAGPPITHHLHSDKASPCFHASQIALEWLGCGFAWL